jgi:hypothetical protein
MKTAAASHRELTDFILGSRLVVAIDPTAIQWRAIHAFRRTIELRERWCGFTAHEPKQNQFNYWYKLGF